MDSGATHHLTSDLNSLALHYPYNGGEEVIIADGTGLTISHIGSYLLSTPSCTLALKDVLYVPDLQKNLSQCIVCVMITRYLWDFSLPRFK